MAAPLLDNEFQAYWLKLSVAEKQTLLSVARHYVELKGEASPASIEVYNQEIDAAMSSIDEGQFYTQEDIVKNSSSWLNGK